MDTRPKTHFIEVEIEFDERHGLSDGRDRLARWLGTFGHTSTGHGFTFKSVACTSPVLIKDDK